MEQTQEELSKLPGASLLPLSEETSEESVEPQETIEPSEEAPSAGLRRVGDEEKPQPADTTPDAPEETPEETAPAGPTDDPAARPTEPTQPTAAPTTASGS